MKKIWILCIGLLLCVPALAQEEVVEGATVAEVVEDEPVREPFNGTSLADMQTVRNAAGGSFEIMIHHRFGLMKEMTDLYGIYGPSNIGIGVNYGITDKFMVGFETEKNNKLQDLHWKWSIMQQTQSGKIPVSLSYYGSVSLDSRPKDVFGETYRFSNRYGFFHQLIMSRKFSSRFSLLGSASYAHFNAVDSVWHNDKAGVGLGGKLRVTDNLSVIGQYDFPVKLKTVRYFQERVKPNLSAGIEINTSTHVFQIFVANYSSIVTQKNYAYNTNDFTKGDFKFCRKY
jgi:hypothetical protein